MTDTADRPDLLDGRDMFRRLTDMFAAMPTSYRMICHPPEGRTEVASPLRGHPLEQAAKSIVVRVAIGKRARRYVLAVVPGDRRVNLAKLAARYGGTGASFATREVAERLAGTVSGTITPFTFSPELDLIVDESLLVHDEIFFNAGRLDLSVGLAVTDYIRLAGPTVASIAA